ncbi:MAG: exopolysaccharide biosynthesis polyprenyl glycosylphosphotransferase, partial [Candidatus Scalindua sp.]|nr:exopolysaccharide biosynthesis polyprenyl glycosylphosphotransferase [Candidatus Scalindua sp.]
IPDLIELATLRGGIGEFEGMPIISLRDTPLYGWNVVVKRVTDIVLSITILLAVSPLMIVISFLVKATSIGPVFYRQERMGLDGRIFSMLKFRTMETQAEKETGPVWAAKGDSRKTIIGSFLRKTSMDELPQFFNVLKGDMSIVGPRPEREFFIQQFRSKIPKYMLRHKMKAGITGWAQISGWRGNTSLEKRIEYDLYYIENWSLWFDLEIMWLTIWRGLVNKHAY